MGRRCFHLAVILTACTVSSVIGAETRDRNVFYLDEWKQPPLQLRALRRTPLTFSLTEGRDVAFLAKGQPVTVIGLGETMHYVEAQTVTGPARGWVKAAALERPPAGLLDALHQRREQAIAHRELIARHEVAVGMTSDEVRESLGNPDRKASVRSPDGRQEQWVYDDYRYVPTYRLEADNKGEMRRVVSYARAVASRKIVTFCGGEVIDVSGQAETEKQPQPPAFRPPPSTGK